MGYFYPRSPCGERLRGWTLNINGPIFLSTLSLRRATCCCCSCTPHSQHFYPRSPCGERHSADYSYHNARPISIHALLAESDLRNSPALLGNSQFLSTLSLRRATLSTLIIGFLERVFLSTLSLRRATVHFDNFNLHCVISIHALLAESDLMR